MEAARRGMNEILFAVIAATVSTVAVFLPLAFLTDATGRLFREFGVTVAAAVGISGFVAITLTPALGARVLSAHSRRARLQGVPRAQLRPHPEPLRLGAAPGAGAAGGGGGRRAGLGRARLRAAHRDPARVRAGRRPRRGALVRARARGQHDGLHRALPEAGRGDRARHPGGRQELLGRVARHGRAGARERGRHVHLAQTLGGPRPHAAAGGRGVARALREHRRRSGVPHQPRRARPEPALRSGVARGPGSRHLRGRALRGRDRAPRAGHPGPGEPAVRSSDQQAAARGLDRPQPGQRPRRVGARHRLDPADPARRGRSSRPSSWAARPTRSWCSSSRTIAPIRARCCAPTCARARAG